MFSRALSLNRSSVGCPTAVFILGASLLCIPEACAGHFSIAACELCRLSHTPETLQLNAWGSRESRAGYLYWKCFECSSVNTLQEGRAAEVERTPLDLSFRVLSPTSRGPCSRQVAAKFGLPDDLALGQYDSACGLFLASTPQRPSLLPELSLCTSGCPAVHSRLSRQSSIQGL